MGGLATREALTRSGSGMHAIKDRPVVVDGKIEIRPIMVVALTYDHRLLDGREAVTFLGKWSVTTPVSTVLTWRSAGKGVHRGPAQDASCAMSGADRGVYKSVMSCNAVFAEACRECRSRDPGERCSTGGTNQTRPHWAEVATLHLPACSFRPDTSPHRPLLNHPHASPSGPS